MIRWNEHTGPTVTVRGMLTAAFCVSFLLSHLTQAYAQSTKEIEYRFKAIYLLNFLQFIEWPDSVLKEKHAPVVLAVIGDDPFGGVLDETFRGEAYNGHPILIARFASVEEAGRCHIMFISASEKSVPKEQLKRLSEASILTVSDLSDFGEDGGGIGFFMEKNKVKFEINIAALKQGNLKASSKLLRLAKIVQPM